MLNSKQQLVLISTFAAAAIFWKRSILFYGLVNDDQLDQYIEKVVDVLGGGDPAVKLLAETAAAETNYGKAVDRSWNVGVGVMQFDPIGFDDVKARTSERVKDIVQKEFGIIIDRTYIGDLRHSPMLSVIFARLKYRLIPSPIPADVHGRAAYWKKWYNSELGAGTIDHYLHAAANNGLA